jgi:murein DD-endopeptidase MepM/ murein hydrolase activator NlpD
MNPSIKAKISDFAWRGAGISLITSVLILSAPFVNSPTHKEQLSPVAANSPKPESRFSVRLHSGDTLASVLKRIGIKPPSAQTLLKTVRPFLDPKKIRPGDKFNIVLNPQDRTVESMEFVFDDNLIRVKATAEGWFAERREIPSVRESRVVRGVIKDSLYESGIDAGLSPQHILDLAKIFESDIDFFSDFQPRDVFNVIIEEIRYANGRRGAGRILAAELEVENDIFDAFYFIGKDGGGDYYNSNGDGLRRSFLRAPLSYVRISSPFNRNRLHPIFRRVRPHLAIDYAAPRGSPVVAVGRGRIEFVGWRNGYGNVVDIRHSGEYMSRYAHFSSFARRLRKGETVDAGEVIGYVGQTGHATGPHLHFEFLRGRTKINFLDLRIPRTRQLAGEDLSRFHRVRDQHRTMMRKDERVVEDARKDLSRSGRARLQTEGERGT